MASVDKITIDGTNYDIDATTVSGHTVATDVPSGAVFTDTKVAQEADSTSTFSYPILLAYNANASIDDSDYPVRKANKLFYQPKNGAVTLGNRSDGTCSTASIVLGEDCDAKKKYSMAIGKNVDVYSENGLAAGRNITLYGNNSVAFGEGTTSESVDQLVIGKYNVNDVASTYAFIIGNGNNTNRSNAFQVAWNGNTKTAGTIYSNALTGEHVLVSSATGGITEGTVTSTELNRLSGVTNNVQTQLDGKISPGNLNTYVFTRDFTVSAKTVTSKGAAAYTKSDSIPATGERLLGVVGYEVSGTNRTSASIYKTGVTQNSGFEVGVYNPNSSDQSWGLTVTCLYLKVSSS